MIDMRRAAAVAGVVLLVGLATATARQRFRPAARPPSYRPPTTTPAIRPGMPKTAAKGSVTNPRLSYRPAATVQREITGVVAGKPADALRLLGGGEARQVLSVTARAALARLAIEALAVKVETPGQLSEAMREIRSARGQAADLPESTRGELKKLAETAERRFVERCLEDVGVSLERGQWKELGDKVTGWGRQVRDGAWSTDSRQAGREGSAYQLKGPAKEALTEASKLAARLDPIDRYEKLLRNLDVKKAGESADGLARLERDKLPASLRAGADGLRGLAEVQHLAGEKWSAAPDAAAVKESVGRFERGRGDAADANLAKQLQQELAVKAFVAGHAEGYFELMPKDGPAEHAGALLRDMKRLVLGEGKVETLTAVDALPKTEPGQGPAGARPPPGVEPFLPEGPRDGWRPPVRDSAKADLQPLKKAVEAGAAMKQKAEAGAAKERKAAEADVQRAKDTVKAARDKVIAPEAGERKRLREVEVALDRKLRPAEVVRVRSLAQQGKSNEQIAAAVKKAGGENDEDFVKRVEKLLGRSLKAAERVRALRLKGQGRTAAEVAGQLRAGGGEE